ncbi:lipopolysaccharide/colanic/teichoic acid biosynthesis glycosyltransferase [Actinomadura coerulea]|uniref:Lipopolysaccharide/colanic/teichoic acid biosynthesis glycosyltransferase n=2 Tax=Actinomadura coerulea TaxID=46159 RepID=A0A7X0G115_9ACTN|nr:lipopolysaccharide/colanic/teichoic acid biosynthesis glycosyltransferase [Actinomadura coerulea]
MRVVVTAGTVIWLWDWNAPVFKQERIGQYGDPFIMRKWCTMKGGQVTPPGEYMRRRTLDETLNWVNVSRHEMSWTGPRPLVAKEIFHDPQAFRCERGLTMQGVLGTTRFNRWYQYGYTPFLPGLCSTFRSHDFQPGTPEYMKARAEANLEHAETATPEGDRELMTQMFARMTNLA